jgi:hypothetical protein
MRASRELGIQSPMRELGITKAEIRALAQEMGLPNWDRPSEACLASRFPYGNRITDRKMSQVAEGEGWLRWCFASRDVSRLAQGVQRLESALRLKFSGFAAGQRALIGRSTQHGAGRFHPRSQVTIETAAPAHRAAGADLCRSRPAGVHRRHLVRYMYDTSYQFFFL